MTTVQQGLSHCLHHGVHFEWCYDYNERVAYIKSNKAQEEQERWLANFWLFPNDLLPPHLVKAYAEWDEAYAEWAKANAKVAKAYAEVVKAYAEVDKAKAEVVKAYAEVDKAYAEVVKANAEWVKVLAANLPALIAIHDRLVAEQGYVCTWNGRDIF